MFRGSPGRQALLAAALLAGTAGCGEPQDVPEPAAPLAVELVRVEQGLYDATAHFRVRNTGGRALRYEGYGSGIPFSRVALENEGTWVERTPVWLECDVGRDVFDLAPGAEAAFEVLAQRPDLPMRVGVGTWEPAGGPPPVWSTWDWVWSDEVVVLEELQLSEP